MRVLITGANGQLGRELVTKFEAGGHHEVIATDRTSLDLASRDSVLGAITTNQPDVIVASGAFTAVDRCESEPETAFGVNAIGTRNIVDAADRVGAHVLYVSTDYVFDGTLDRPYDEWDTPNPQSVYGRSKLAGESELRPEDTIVRTAWVFGRHGSNMVKTILRLAESNPRLSFVNDQRGNPTCAEDLAGCIYGLVVGRMPGIFHATNSGETTWYQFARDVLEAAGQDPNRVTPISTAELKPARPAPRPANSVLANVALKLQSQPELADHRYAIKRVVKELLSQ